MSKVVPSTVSDDSEEIHSISYLRGLAALGVVFYHVRMDLWVGFNYFKDNPSMAGSFAKWVSWPSLPSIFMGSGVMLFFVISGFCIHYPYAGRKGKRLDLPEYAVRRFCRIYPPYLAAVLFTFAVQCTGYCHGFPGGLDWRNTQLSAFLLQNSLGGQPECNPALWTIPVEVEFYLFFPLIYLGIRRFCRITLAAGLVITVLAIAFSHLSPIHGSFLPYWFTWIAGAALAEQHKKGELQQPSWPIGLAAVFSLFLGFFCTWHMRANDVLAQGGGGADVISLVESLAYGIAFSVLLWWSITHPRVYARLPSPVHGLLMHLGAISYSLYLFHMPLFRLCGWIWTSHFGEKPVNYLIIFPFVVLALVLASITYRYVEAPAHAAGRRLASHIKLCRSNG